MVNRRRFLISLSLRDFNNPYPAQGKLVEYFALIDEEERKLVRTLPTRCDSEVLNGICAHVQQMLSVSPERILQFDRPKVETILKLIDEVRRPLNCTVSMAESEVGKRTLIINGGSGQIPSNPSCIFIRPLETQVFKIRELKYELQDLSITTKREAECEGS